MTRWDKYDVSGNVEAQFADEAEDVLINKLGVSSLPELQVLEEFALGQAYECLLGQVRVDTPMTTELIRHVHREIFGGLFEWAGRWRTVVISRPGTIWPPPQYLDAAMMTFQKTVLPKCKPSLLAIDEDFVAASAELQGEFLAIHPFREGNGRTIKLVNDLLAAQTGRPMLAYDKSDMGAVQYINAAKAALATQDYGPLRDIIHSALRAAQQ